MTPFTHRTHGRNRRAVVVFLTYCTTLLIALIWFDVALWIVVLFVLFALPLVWDILSNRESVLTLDDHAISWQSGNHTREVLRANIRTVRFDTRLDFSVRVTLLLRDDGKIRLPYDVLPPHRELEAAMTDRGIATERHHFTLL